MKISAQDLIRKTSDVASLPLVFVRLNQEVNNPHCSIHRLATIIMEDAGLSARLLRIVNSALYQYPSKIDSISVAVTVIGTEQLRDLALATSVMTLFKNMPADLVNMNSFWCHSLGCGIVARLLAGKRKEIALERYFLAGVLHDIGRLLIYQNCGDEMRRVLKSNLEDPRHFYEVEKEQLGFNHPEVGGLLLERWKIPSILAEMVSCHHQPENAREYPLGPSLVHIADIIAHSLQLGNSGDLLVPALSPVAWKQSGLDPEDLEMIFEQVQRQYDDLIKVIFQNE